MAKYGKHAERAVIDEDGIVRHRHDRLLGLDNQTVDDPKAALDTLPARPPTRVRDRSVLFSP